MFINEETILNLVFVIFNKIFSDVFSELSVKFSCVQDRSSNESFYDN